MATAAMKRMGLEDFFEQLASVKQRVLLLDYDGTLAPFCADRLSARPYGNVPELLEAVVASGTRVVLVTGRPVVELKSMLPACWASEIWGSHGLERLRRDGSYEVTEMPLAAVQSLGRLDHCLEAAGLRPVVEFKPGATAIHWRGLGRSLVTDIRQRVIQVWVGLQPQDMITLCEFDGGIEFRLRWPNKGHAVHTILSEFDGRVTAAYLGDDLTDEDAFRAIKQAGLSVLVRRRFRPTAADVWLRPPDELLQFLSDWLHACGGEA